MCEFTDRLTRFLASFRTRSGSARPTVSPERSPQDSRPAAHRLFLAHPFLLAVAPIVLLYVQNIEERDTQAMLGLCAASLVMTAVVLGAARLLVRDTVRAACLTSVFNLLFFTYGRVFDLAVARSPLSLSYRTWHVLLALSCLTLVGYALVWLRDTRRDLWSISRFLTSALAILMIMMLAPVVPQLLSERTDATAGDQSVESSHYEKSPPLAHDSPETPDIYYIILDGYARADVLKRVYDLDNTPFIEALRRRGFYVPDQSCANYPFTYLSLASSLNLQYLDHLFPPQSTSKSRMPFYQLIWDALVPRIFQSKGYRTVHFHTNYLGTQKTNVADIDVSLRPLWMQTEFVEVFIRTTALRLIEPSVAEMHLHAFRSLLTIPKIEGPTFTFAHLIVPHRPFIFDCDGNVKREVVQSLQFGDKGDTWQDLQGYRDQVQFVNKKIGEVVDHILSTSPHPPIIIIQGDHGSAATWPGKKIKGRQWDEFAQERIPILNAYYVPEKMRARLYPTISPVNTFRILLTECFGENFEQLPERHYIAWYHNRFNLRDVTAVMRGEKSPDEPEETPAVAEKPKTKKRKR